MVAKITKGSSASGALEYITRNWKLKPMESCMASDEPDLMCLEFDAQAKMNPRVEINSVHISLDFSPEDKPKLEADPELMKTIAHDYMERMGIRDTLFVIVRHNDHDHPHCHIVYSRVDNNGKTISDHNDRFRSQKACEDITRQYGLHWGESRKKVNRERLRPHDAAKYHISDILEVLVSQCRNWEQIERTLTANGISVEFKCNPNTGERQGVSFGYDDGKENHVFPGSKVGKEYSFAHLSRTLDRNQKSYEKRTRSIEVQATWANLTPPKEQASVLEEGVGMAVGAIGALGDLFQTHAPEGPQTLEEFDRMRKKYAQKPRRGLKH